MTAVQQCWARCDTRTARLACPRLTVVRDLVASGVDGGEMLQYAASAHRELSQLSAMTGLRAISWGLHAARHL